MKVIIDGNEIEFTDNDKNLLELARRHGIDIPELCYEKSTGKGCCRACVVEVDGSQKFACGTEPEDGMNISVARPDLDELRRQRTNEYELKEPGSSPDGCCC